MNNCTWKLNSIANEHTDVKVWRLKEESIDMAFCIFKPSIILVSCTDWEKLQNCECCWVIILVIMQNVLLPHLDVLVAVTWNAETENLNSKLLHPFFMSSWRIYKFYVTMWTLNFMKMKMLFHLPRQKNFIMKHLW